MRFTQPSLFASKNRATVSFFGRFGPYKRRLSVSGGARKATRKFGGDSWFRKQQKGSGLR